MPYRESLLYENLKNEEYLEFIRNSYVSISLTSIIADFYKINTPEKLFNDYHFISSQEFLILKVLKEENINSVTINFTRDGKMDRLEIRKSKEIDLASRVIDNIIKNGYEDLSIKSANGKILYSENTRKIKF